MPDVVVSPFINHVTIDPDSDCKMYELAIVSSQKTVPPKIDVAEGTSKRFIVLINVSLFPTQCSKYNPDPSKNHRSEQTAETYHRRIKIKEKRKEKEEKYSWIGPKKAGISTVVSDLC